jgi:hypothetical protein
VDGVFLTPDDLRQLTGLRRPSSQYEWLLRDGWPVQRDAKGRPLVLRSVVEARLGGVVSKAVEPRWEALHGP